MNCGLKEICLKYEESKRSFCLTEWFVRELEITSSMGGHQVHTRGGRRSEFSEVRKNEPPITVHPVGVRPSRKKGDGKPIIHKKKTNNPFPKKKNDRKMPEGGEGENTAKKFCRDAPLNLSSGV